MALSKGIQGARHSAQLVIWTDAGGDVQDLTGAVITGRLEDKASGEKRDMDGTFTVVDGPAGKFTWAYGEEDVGTPGKYKVQFTATYPDALNDKTLETQWEVERAL